MSRHAVHEISSVVIPEVQPFVPGLQRVVTRKEAVFCLGCDLYVERPEGQASVGAAVVKWEREHRDDWGN